MKPVINVEDWMNFRPYENLVKTDGYYIKVANKILKVLYDDDFVTEYFEDEKELKLLACFLVSYLEDIVSGTNIWNTFVRLHKEKYNKFVPFFDHEEYFVNEVNLIDIKFLIWYFYNIDLLNDIYFFDDIDVAVEKIFEIISEEYEYAPENEYLKSIYNLESKYYELYEVRNVIQRLLYGSYLFQIDTGRRLSKLLENELQKGNLDDYQRTNMILKSIKDDSTYSFATSLLAMKGKEWLAEILGKEHYLYNELFKMSDKTTGYFFYKSQDDKYIYLEHIATGTEINLLKSSFDYHQELKKNKIILIGGIVKWCGEWWLSGFMTDFDFDEQFIKNVKNDPKNKNTNFNKEENYKLLQEIIDEQLKAFLEFNNNSKIAFSKKNELKQFMNNFIEFYNHKIAIKNNIENKNLKVQVDLNEILLNEKLPDDIILFFNDKSGVEIVFGIKNVFPIENNTEFNPELSDEDFRFLVNSNISTELCYYVIENFKEKIPYFKEPEGVLIVENIDFLLRFFKKENYYTEYHISQV